MEGVRGDSYDGDVAIDDVSFSSGCKLYSSQLPPAPSIPPTVTPTQTTPAHSCGANEFNCQSQGPYSCIPRKKTCNFRRDCTDGSDEAQCVRPLCDFSSGDLCNWMDEQPQSTRKKRALPYSWQVGQGSVASQGTGPSADHTTGTQPDPTHWVKKGHQHLDQGPTDCSKPAAQLFAPFCLSKNQHYPCSQALIESFVIPAPLIIITIPFFMCNVSLWSVEIVEGLYWRAFHHRHTSGVVCLCRQLLR